MAEAASKRRPEGVTLRHRQGCSGGEGGTCRSRPAYQTQVYSPRDRRTIRKTFKTLSEARGWRADTATALRQGAMRAPTRTTLSEAADEWLSAARAGIARTRSGDPYKPSALRSYEEALATKVLIAPRRRHTPGPRATRASRTRTARRAASSRPCGYGSSQAGSSPPALVDED